MTEQWNENNSINWNNEGLQIENLNKCIKYIDMNKTSIGNGEWGLVYKVKWQNEDCALKIVPIKDNDASWNEEHLRPLLHETSLNKFNKEKNILTILSKKNICPQLYESGICIINRKYGSRIDKVKIGYFLSEWYDQSIMDLFKKISDEIMDKITNKPEKVYKTFLKILTLYEDIDKKLNMDLKRALKRNILNRDVNNIHNIMIKNLPNEIKVSIIDWGNAEIVDKNKIISLPQVNLTLDMINSILQDINSKGLKFDTIKQVIDKERPELLEFISIPEIVEKEEKSDEENEEDEEYEKMLAERYKKKEIKEKEKEMSEPKLKKKKSKSRKSRKLRNPRKTKSIKKSPRKSRR